jgi:hypothetical protein
MSAVQVVLGADGKTTTAGQPHLSDTEGLDLRAYALGVQQLLQAVDADPVMTILAPSSTELSNYSDLAAIEAWLLKVARVRWHLLDTSDRACCCCLRNV